MKFLRSDILLISLIMGIGSYSCYQFTEIKRIKSLITEAIKVGTEYGCALAVIHYTEGEILTSKRIGECKELVKEKK